MIEAQDAVLDEYGNEPAWDTEDVPAVEPISIEIDIPVEAVARFIPLPTGKVEGVIVKGEVEQGVSYLLVRQVL